MIILKQSTPTILKINVGGYLYPVEFEAKGGRIIVRFGFNRGLIDMVKTLGGARWDGEKKQWSIDDSLRNCVRLAYLTGDASIYDWYDSTIKHTHMPTRKLREHQLLMFKEALQYRRMIWAAEMGTGKTLTAIEVMEWAARFYKLKNEQIWYVGPNSGVRAVTAELRKWQTSLSPVMHTYDGFREKMKNWPKGKPAPFVLILDESSRCKNWTAARTKAAAQCAWAVQAEHDGIVIEMTGTPAPKSPVDWWAQCEIVAPGFLKEGDPMRFKANLCLIEQTKSLAGGTFPKLITWFDDPAKCKICGQTADKHMVNRKSGITTQTDFKIGFSVGKSDTVSVALQQHGFEPSENMVAKLYNRMKGLVRVIWKKDCLDLPEKTYEIVQCKPTVDMLRAALIIKKTATRTITALSDLRQLSDGFQYFDLVTGQTTCDLCHGNKTIMLPDLELENTAPTDVIPESKLVERDCPQCKGTGQTDVIERSVKDVGSPKDAELCNLLDMYEDVGRIVIWGGFQGTLDRIEKICKDNGWEVMRVDGKGVTNAHLMDAMDLSHPRYKELLEKHEKVAVVSNPEAGGMAYTWTAAPAAIYYSNSFNGESRSQSEDRIHRMGMMANRACTIYDLYCLPSDKVVHDNLKLKRRLQDLTMGEIDV